MVYSSKGVVFMLSKSITKMKMAPLNEFDFQIKYSETDQKSHWHEIDLHIHNEFELYINLSGDVSFLVENSLYPVSRGDVIIARPGERHHCVYRSDKPHKLFWILFNSEKNKHLLDFLKDDFKENYISTSDELRCELIELCSAFHSNELSKEEQLYSFFRIFAILKESKKKSKLVKNILPYDLSRIIDYIDKHINEQLTVTQIADNLYISQSTLERHFKQILNITPLEYIRKKKLILAAQLLQNGESVLHTGIKVGYNDNSYFIQLFKRYYGCTPHEYKSVNGIAKAR